MFHALTGEYVDLVKAGIIDPVKVIRTALVNAVRLVMTFLASSISPFSLKVTTPNYNMFAKPTPTNFLLKMYNL